MTEWRNWAAWRQILRVADDQLGSAATVGVDGARAVSQLAATVSTLAPEAYPEAVYDAVGLLYDRQGVNAPIANLRNLVYLTAAAGPDRLGEALGEFAAQILASTERLAAVGAELIESGALVLVHAHSTSVRAVLDEARRNRSFSVSCTEAFPTGEGAEMASELAAAGHDVELLPDDVAVELIGGMDLVLAGADALGPGQAINKVGTGEIAGAAVRGEVPIYLVAATGKLLPPVLFQEATLLRGAEGISELVELERVDGVVTEMGILSPGEVTRLARTRIVAAEIGAR